MEILTKKGTLRKGKQGRKAVTDPVITLRFCTKLSNISKFGGFDKSREIAKKLFENEALKIV